MPIKENTMDALAITSLLNGVGLQVICGTNSALLHLDKLKQGSKGSCVWYNDTWMTPNSFQMVSGRQTAKDWKRSIRHFGKTLKWLLANKVITLEPPACNCDSCLADQTTFLNVKDSLLHVCCAESTVQSNDFSRPGSYVNSPTSVERGEKPSSPTLLEARKRRRLKRRLSGKEIDKKSRCSGLLKLKPTSSHANVGLILSPEVTMDMATSQMMGDQSKSGRPFTVLKEKTLDNDLCVQSSPKKNKSSGEPSDIDNHLDETDSIPPKRQAIASSPSCYKRSPQHFEKSTFSKGVPRSPLSSHSPKGVNVFEHNSQTISNNETFPPNYLSTSNSTSTSSSTSTSESSRLSSASSISPSPEKNTAQATDQQDRSTIQERNFPKQRPISTILTVTGFAQALTRRDCPGERTTCTRCFSAPWLPHCTCYCTFLSHCSRSQYALPGHSFSVTAGPTFDYSHLNLCRSLMATGNFSAVGCHQCEFPQDLLHPMCLPALSSWPAVLPPHLSLKTGAYFSFSQPSPVLFPKYAGLYCNGERSQPSYDHRNEASFFHLFPLPNDEKHSTHYSKGLCTDRFFEVPLDLSTRTF